MYVIEAGEEVTILFYQCHYLLFSLLKIVNPIVIISGDHQLPPHGRGGRGGEGGQAEVPQVEEEPFF